jgi:hypothetical protein
LPQDDVVIPARGFGRAATCGIFTASLLVSAPLFAEVPRASSTPRKSAAQSYDRGVAEFDRGQYGLAARSFLDADSDAPSVDALRNALIAARKARDAALVHEAAERALAREKAAPELANDARDALAEAETWNASSPAANEAVEPAPAVEESPPEPPSRAPSTATSTAAGEHADRARHDHAWARPAFITGVAATAALTGLVIWSGIDTLNKRSELSGSQHGNDEVYGAAHRTDALLASALVVGAATAYVGFVWVDWRKSETATAVRVEPGGATLLVRGRF